MTGDLAPSTDHIGRRNGHLSSGRARDTAHGSPGAVRSTPTSAMDLCRLTVLARSVQVDLALPTDVPIALLVPGIVDVLDRRGRAQPSDPDDDRRPRSWVLSRVGQPPLEATRTLNEAAVRDGELLVLGDAESPAPLPLYDDLMQAVAVAGTSRLWTPRTAQSVGFGCAATALLLACLALLRSPVAAGDRFAGDAAMGLAAAVAGVVFVVAGSVVGRVYGDDRTGVFLSGAALPLMFTAGVSFVPGALGAPHLLLGASVCGATAILAMRLGGHGAALFTGAAMSSGTAVAASAVIVTTDRSISAVGAGVTVFALAALACAPRMSMMQARLPLPPVPTAGASLDGASDSDTPSVASLERQAADARSYLTGLVCAASAAAAVGALCAALAGHPLSAVYRPGAALALLTAFVLLMRGRTFAEVHHAIPPVTAGSFVVLVLSAAAVLDSPDRMVLGFVAAIALAAVAIVFGVLVPGREYSPVLRRAAELVEFAAIAAIVPVACWVCGLYAAMRGL